MIGKNRARQLARAILCTKRYIRVNIAGLYHHASSSPNTTDAHSFGRSNPFKPSPSSSCPLFHQFARVEFRPCQHRPPSDCRQVLFACLRSNGTNRLRLRLQIGLQSLRELGLSLVSSMAKDVGDRSRSHLEAVDSPFVSGRKRYSRGTQRAGTMMKTK
jgi:hypothetical protein